MKAIKVDRIISTISKMCQEANYGLSEDMNSALRKSIEKEESPLGKDILKDICRNLDIAKTKQMPICQDTGTAVVFVELGQEVYIEGGLLTDAINEGVRRGYAEGYLRKSIVENPIQRVNTRDNTPAIIHYEVVSGDTLTLTVAPKGGGSENMSRVYMLTPSQGEEGIINAVMETVHLAGPNACLPMVIGIGIGGNFEKCTMMAKKALMRSVGMMHGEVATQELENRLLEKINNTGIGPQGLGGRITALAVHIETYPCHIASMPLAINIGCHVNRHITKVL